MRNQFPPPAGIFLSDSLILLNNTFTKRTANVYGIIRPCITKCRFAHQSESETDDSAALRYRRQTNNPILAAIRHQFWNDYA